MQKEIQQQLKEFDQLLQKCTLTLIDKNNPQALSQIYKMMNYKPVSNRTEKLSNQEIKRFLNRGKDISEFDMYDDILYYDQNKIKELVLRQNFLIAKGLFDPKQYFQSIKIDSLDDTNIDNKIKAMFT